MPRRRKNEWRIWLPGGAGPAPSLRHCKWSAPNPRSGITSRSRGALRPRFASRFALRRNGGRREDRVLAAPAVPRAICANKTAHEHTGQLEHSGLPCAMALRLISCSSRRTAFLPPSPALLRARLAPAPRRPNHTTSPYASRPLVCARFASIASHRTVVTIASAPLWVRRAELCD